MLATLPAWLCACGGRPATLGAADARPSPEDTGVAERTDAARFACAGDAPLLRLDGTPHAVGVSSVYGGYYRSAISVRYAQGKIVASLSHPFELSRGRISLGSSAGLSVQISVLLVGKQERVYRSGVDRLTGWVELPPLVRGERRTELSLCVEGEAVFHPKKVTRLEAYLPAPVDSPR